MFVSLDGTRKNGTKFFVILRTANFCNVCFYRPLRSQRNDLIICTIFVKIHCGPWYLVAWHMSCAIKRWKVGQNFFITGKIAFSSKLSFSNNLIGPKKCSYIFQNRCQNGLRTLINWSLMFVTLDDMRKNELLSSWRQLFFETFVSIDLLGPKEMILSIAHYLTKYIVDPDKLLPDICHVQ